MTTYPLSMPQEAAWLSSVILLVVLVAVPLVWWQTRGRSGAAAALAVTIMAAVAVLIFYLIVIAPRLTNVAVGDGLLQVNTPPYVRLEISRQEILAAYLADWQEVAALAPVLRTGGTAIADYRTGNFQLRNGAEAVIMATGSRVLVLRLAERFVLLAPDDFDAFLEEFAQRVVSLQPAPLAELAATVLVEPPGMPPIARIVFLASGLFIILFGYLIRFKKMLFLLSGYDERKVKDKDALAYFVGNFVMLSGFAMLVVQFFALRGIIVFSVAMIPLSIYAIYKMNKL
ncbi:MAG: PH domain-containing protein [Firmicutes bacterium]|jgi:hypothetical protein|nr:PH domain-containing protein [Bacillota bacterium]MCL5992746.1 PH domain-containing protein [Bacillota bacterium]